MGDTFDAIKGLQEAFDKTQRRRDKDRETEDSHLQDKADWNRMEADIERLTKERDEARQILLDRIGDDDEAVAYFKKRWGIDR